MTSTEFAALKMTIPGATPFAGAATGTQAEPGLIVPGATTGAFSMPDGFDATFDAAPTATGANMVQRGQINYIGKMASYAPFMGQAGCSYWGFDPAVCIALGGYWKGAVLTQIIDGCYLKIISLVDNNMVDFTATTDTTQSAYSTIVNGSVDGVNWQYLSLDPQTLIDQSIVAEIPNFSFNRDFNQVLNVFKSTNQAALVVSGGIECEVEEKEESEEGGVRHYLYSLGIVVSPPYNTLTEVGNWTTKTSGNTTIYEVGGEGASINAKAIVTTPGKYYALGLVGSSWAPTGSVSDDWSLKVTVKASTVKVHLKILP